MSFVDIGEGLVTLINDGSYSQPVTAVRVSIPIWELEDIRSLVVEVFPSEEIWVRGARNIWDATHIMGIAIRDKIADRDDDDALLNLVKEIKQRIASAERVGGAILTQIADAEPFNPQLHEQQKLFSHVVLASFQDEVVP